MPHAKAQRLKEKIKYGRFEQEITKKTELDG
jgi:hypothetical protein